MNRKKLEMQTKLDRVANEVFVLKEVVKSQDTIIERLRELIASHRGLLDTLQPVIRREKEMAQEATDIAELQRLTAIYGPLPEAPADDVEA